MRAVTALCALISLATFATGAPNRIEGPVAQGRAVVLPNSVHPAVRRASDRGRMEPNARITGITLMLAPSDAQAAELERFLEAQRDPASPDYQNWVTPEEYGERFGLSENDFAMVRSWLEAGGFTIEGAAHARNWFLFSGAAADLEHAFHTELHRVMFEGELHFANTADIRIPAALAGIVGGVRGLDDFRPQPLHTGTTAKPDMNASGGAHYLAPADFATIYDLQALYNAGYDGTGQKLAVVGQSDPNLNDLRAFRAQFSLPPKDPQLVLAGSDPGSNPGDQTEATLDLEWSGAVAKNAAIIYVYSQNVFQSLQYAIDQNLAPVISLSYGGCELQASTTYRTLAQQANAQGITWITAAGDSGAAGCDPAGEAQARNGAAAAFPADIPEVTAVGGTEFSEGTGFYWQAQNRAGMQSAVSYIPEKAWNDSALGNGLVAGGGAASLIYSKPWWQAGTGVPNDQARDVPDISLAASGAHDAYALYLRGQMTGSGGTSAAAPAFAGIVAILNQYLLAKGSIAKPGLGNINPALYNLAQNSTGSFHDIVSGNNSVPCVAGSKGCVNGSEGYSAGVGYDLATGLGSVDAWNLVTKWTSVPPVAGTTISLTATPASVVPAASVQLTATVTSLSGSNGPVGTVSFAAGPVALGSAILTGSGPVETASITVKGSSLATGLNTITATYHGSVTLLNPSATASVAVAAPSTAPAIATRTLLTAVPAIITQTGSAVLTATVQAATGSNSPTGTVGFTVGNTLLGIANLTAGVANLTVRGSSLAIGSNTINASYAPAGNFSRSSGIAAITVSAPPAATVTTVSATPTTIAPSAAAQVYVIVKASAGTAIPSGTVSLLLGTKTVGFLPLSNGSASGLLSGGALSVGPNLITAAYVPTGNFAASGASVTINVTSPPISTTLTVTSAPGSQSSTTVLTATLKAATGNATPAGTVTFGLGTALLGTATLSGAAGTATGTLTLNNNVLAPGNNTIRVVFAGSPAFGSSAASVTVKR